MKVRRAVLLALPAVPPLTLALRSCPVVAAVVVQISSIAIYKWNGDVNEPFCLGSALDLAHFGYFQRGTVKEMLLFASRTIIKRTQPGARQSVEHNGACARVRRAAPPRTAAHPRRQSTSRTPATAAGWPSSSLLTGSTPCAPRSGCCSRCARAV